MNEWLINIFEQYPVLFTILAGFLAAHALALFVVNLTPTPRDNEILGKVYRVVEWVAGIVTPKSKESNS